jgi:hypothetical protein
VRGGAPGDTLAVVRSVVGFTMLPEPLRGAWTFQGFPEAVDLGGRSFVRSDRWAAPLPGVLKQYREDVDRKSMHLYVLDDGTWKIDHIDEANPERGLVLEHTFRDVVHTPWGAALLTVGCVGLVAGLSYALTR